MARPLSPHTLANYRRDFERFSDWVRSQGAVPVPCNPELLAEFVGREAAADASPSTLRRIRTAVDYFHEVEGLQGPTAHPSFRKAWADLHQTQKKPAGIVDLDDIAPAELVAMVEALPDSVAGVRDRALLLLAAGLRVSDRRLVQLTVGSVSLRTANKRELLVRLPERGAVGGRHRWAWESREPVRLIGRGPLDPNGAVSAWEELVERELGVRESEAPLLLRVGKGGELHPDGLSGVGATAVVRRAARLAGLADPSTYTVAKLRDLCTQSPGGSDGPG